MAQALDVALPNARSGEGKVDARLRHGGVVDDAEQIERAERSKHKPNPSARQSSCSNTSGPFTALQRSSQVSGWLTVDDATVAGADAIRSDGEGALPTTARAFRVAFRASGAPALGRWRGRRHQSTISRSWIPPVVHLTVIVIVGILRLGCV